MKSFFRRKDNFSANTNRKRVKEKEGDQFRELQITNGLPKKLTQFALSPFPRTPNISSIFVQCPQDKIFMLLVISFDRY